MCSKCLKWQTQQVVVVTVGIIESVLDMVERATNERSGGVLQNISAMRMLRILRIVSLIVLSQLGSVEYL